MSQTRRDFLTESAAYAAGFAGLRLASTPASSWAAATTSPIGFGPLVPDSRGIIDLPVDFCYRVISHAGEEMADGLLLPEKPDGMATFAGPDGLTILMRNHEIHTPSQSAFGANAQRLNRSHTDRLYDVGDGGTPLAGGVTTLVYDTRRQETVRQFLSLGGTSLNCAGGPTPWGTWITCEESVDSPTYSQKKVYSEVSLRSGSQRQEVFLSAESHGYAFEVLPGTKPELQRAVPLRAMGRFRREAVAVDEASGVVYQTEDMSDGAFYRFLPKEPGNLAAGGRLQTLAVRGRPSLDTRNWGEKPQVEPGERLPVEWIDLDDPESPQDDLRYRSFAAGGARFARSEGIWWTDRGGYFACTTGGSAEIGQLWRYEPEGTSIDSGGTLELFIEPNDSNLVHNADNLTAAPWGDLVVCEDREGEVVRLIGVSPAGQLYTLANCRMGAELAGVCFSPDGSTLFVNIQHSGLTLAIVGPWGARA